MKVRFKNVAENVYFPMKYIFKEHVKIVKIYMERFNVSISSMPKVMGFLYAYE